MAHYALIDSNNVVVQVFVGRDENDPAESDWEQYYSHNGLVAKRTSYNTVAGEHTHGGVPFRKNFASAGFTGDEERDAFIPPKPYATWLLDEDTCRWYPPVPKPEETETAWSDLQVQWVPKPDDGAPYVWSEEDDVWLRAL